MPPIILLYDDSIGIFKEIKASRFKSQLIKVKENSYLEIKDSSFSDSSNLDFPNQKEGLALSVQHSSMLVVNTTFNNLFSTKGPSIYAFD